MKAKTISTIRAALKNKKDAAFNDYKALKEKLELKYNTGWLDDIMTDYEKSAFYGLKEEYNEACEVFEDFEKHQW